MARISISIPDKLFARLEPMKDGINISQLCREALERRVAAFERASGYEALDLDGLVKRLRDERSSEASKFEDLGKDNAERWLNAIPFLELKDVAENPSSSNVPKYKLPHTAFKIMKQDMVEAKVSCENGQAVAYKTAWLEYVRSVWTQVEDRAEDSQHRQPAEAQPEEAS